VILINLLPHREEKRKLRKAAYFVGLAMSGLVGAAAVGVGYGVLQQMTAAQRDRNAFLAAEIKKLEVQIKDVATLRSQIESLKARQKAVEDLQVDRNIPVHVLNELVSQTPEGIYFTAVKQDGQVLTVTGIAQTNERVSEFLRRTNTGSVWLTKPELIEIKASTVAAASKEVRRLFDFSVRLTIKRPQDKAAPTDAVPVSAPASAVAAVPPKKT
jgi:type IV pilus assembly protein PilN